MDKHRSKRRLSVAGVGLFRQSLEGRSITLASVWLSSSSFPVFSK